MLLSARQRECFNKNRLQALNRKIAPGMRSKVTPTGRPGRGETHPPQGNDARGVAEGHTPRDDGDRGKERFRVARVSLIRTG